MNEKLNKKYIIAIDGPAASGKSSSAKLLAKKLDIAYLDTGAMYRAVTLFALRNKILLEEEEKLGELTKSLEFEFKYQETVQKVYVNNEDISLEIRGSNVSSNVSDYCQVAIVRELLVEKQRAYANKNGAILDGRDIGTVVFPNADFKFFIVASADVRAKRRVLELEKMGMASNYEEILKNIKERDYKDSHRKISPLKKADDAIELDTSDYTLDEQVKLLYDKIVEGLQK